MTFGYTFPRLRRFDGLSTGEYVSKIREEANEVMQSYMDGKPMEETYIEVMDVMQACETCLRNSGLTMDEIQRLYEMHNAKDRKRGYGEPRPRWTR